MPQRVGAELQARVQGEFRALQQFLQEEEACVLEQMRREQREVTDKLQRHLEDSREAVKELEQNIRALQQAFAASENTTPTEVSVNPVRPLLRTRKSVWSDIIIANAFSFFYNNAFNKSNLRRKEIVHMESQRTNPGHTVRDCAHSYTQSPFNMH